MKIFYINSVCGVGSTGRIVTDMHNTVTSRGHESIIAYGRGTARGVDDKCVFKIGSLSEVCIHALMSRFTDKTGLYSKKGTRELIKRIKEFSPDVIHLHNIHGYYVNIKILFDFLKQYKGKVIWTLHDCWSFTGHCSYFNYIGCEKWKTECDACANSNRYPKSFVDRSKENFYLKKDLFSGIENMTLVTPSAWLANLVKQSFLGSYSVKVINNGIDTEIFKPTQSDFKQIHNLTHKKIVLGVANVWSTRKGMNDMFKLADMLGDSYQVVLVGLNDKQCKCIPDNVLGIKRTNSVKELAAIYTAVDVFVNPTYDDNYPTVNLEAFACGTPCITYATGGSVESVHNKMIVKKGDVEGIYKLITANELYLGELDHIDKSCMVEQYIKLYEAQE